MSHSGRVGEVSILPPQDSPPPHLAPLAVCSGTDADPIELARAILLGQPVALQVAGTPWLVTPEQLREQGHTALRLIGIKLSPRVSSW